MSTNKIETTDKLSDRELDARIAVELMGLVPCAVAGHDLCYALPESPNQGGELKSYSSEIGDAMLVEDRIAELGLEQEYVEALARVIAADLGESRLISQFDFIHATARQRSLAALATKEKE